MDIKLPQIKNLKKIEKNIFEALRLHIALTWIIFGFIILLYTGYIFYFNIYIATITPISPLIQIPTAKKIQLDQILKDLKDRENKRNEFDSKKLANPFSAN